MVQIQAEALRVVKNFKSNVLKMGLDSLYYSGAYKLLRPSWQGVGAIFMLHHVRSGADGERKTRFSPNGILEVTPEFLEQVILHVRQKGLDIVSLDEAHRRLVEGDFSNRFVCFTLDDGYLDNLEVAYPVFKKHDCPFTVYVATSFPDGEAELWWLALEKIIAQSQKLEVELNGEKLAIDCAKIKDKYAAWERIYWPLREMGEAEQRRFMRRFAAAHDVDMTKFSRDLSMSWEQISQLASDPLADIGAHGVNHLAIGKLDASDMLREVTASCEIIAARTGINTEHFCYPYGDPASAAAREFAAVRKAGFKTAVTTRKGVLFAGHAVHLTALPRISLNGDYQSIHYVELFLSGAPFTLWNRFRKIDAA